MSVLGERDFERQPITIVTEASGCLSAALLERTARAARRARARAPLRQRAFVGDAETAFRFGGTLDKLSGDAVMFFGAAVMVEPRLQARRCLEMDFAVQRALRALNDQWRAQGLVRASASR